MIPVEFTVEPGVSVEEHLDFVKTLMPWLQYLIDHSYDVKHTINYDAPRHLNLVRYSFYLPPKNETFYRLKYGSN